MSPGRRDRLRPCVTLLFVTATLSACAAPSQIVATGSDVSASGLGVTAASISADPGPVPMALLPGRITAAAEVAAARGATVTVAVLDRVTGARTIGGANVPLETASVVKLFIADDLLFRERIGELLLTDDDHALIDVMLTSSDDYAASTLWDAYGGPEMVDRVADRHDLTGTVASDSSWWNTTTTASDLLTWYDDLLSGTGGLDETATTRIVGALMDFDDTGSDGYDQRFGLPDGLPDAIEPGMKAGWMCCIDDSWVHLSTGFFGTDHRYVLAVLAKETVTYGEDDPEYGGWFLPDTSFYDAAEDASARHARETVTLVVADTLG
ncbi:MAG: serine hydrolase [Rhodococcus sp.]|uniref:serine hydrolase n=1 Tax=Rhodococcus sp. TaxID=1831 RepID=UPI0016BC7F1C|nr:serine hydrolase [Rhodococcus sp. (in: high G+C Gram-positive bacteria)]NLV80133.1 serine hydrolase [Rhodococcus sp. (in: high G+C Gram-positive bacteria)]